LGEVNNHNLWHWIANGGRSDMPQDTKRSDSKVPGFTLAFPAQALLFS